ncbi:hypothetical protein Bbelb_164650 [Branchiostoma belcheri]|nr:hypothetical protein Bbelb_164650 [Branchiostoma belcheri]
MTARDDGGGNGAGDGAGCQTVRHVNQQSIPNQPYDDRCACRIAVVEFWTSPPPQRMTGKQNSPRLSGTGNLRLESPENRGGLELCRKTRFKGRRKTDDSKPRCLNLAAAGTEPTTTGIDLVLTPPPFVTLQGPAGFYEAIW